MFDHCVEADTIIKKVSIILNYRIATSKLGNQMVSFTVMHRLFTCTFLILVLLQYKCSLAGYTTVTETAKNITKTANNITVTAKKTSETANNLSKTANNINETENIIFEAVNNTSETAINISETANSTKKLSQVDESTLSLGKGTREEKIVTDKNKFQDRWKQEILDTLTEICGEPYKPCSKEFFGFKTFKKTSVCKSCSCNAFECQISKNCCPDVEIDHSHARKDDSILKPVCATLSDRVSGQKAELESNQSHKNNESVTPASLKDWVNIQSDDNEEEITKATELELTTQTSTENDLEFSDLWNGTAKTFYQSVKMNKNKTKYANNTQISTDSQSQNENNSENTIMPGEKSSSASVIAESIFPKYLVTDFCPSEYLDTDVSARCNNKASSFLLDYIPVSDMYGSKIYANRWCAQCHNVSNSKSWRLETDCLQLYPMDYLPSIITDFHKLTKNCTVRLLPPTYLDMDSQLCNTLPTYKTIDKCNVTGLWKKNNTLMNDLCAQRDFVPYYRDRQKAQTTIYKNIFCYICNTFGNMNISKDTTDERETDFTFEERKLELEASVDEADTLSQGWSLGNNQEPGCSKGTILDIYSGDCVQFECPIHQHAMGNICLNINKDVRGLVLASTTYLDFQQPVYIGETLNEITRSGKQIIETIDKQMLISDSGCDIRYIKVFVNLYESSRGYIQEMFLESKIANTENCSVENLILIYTNLNSGTFDIYVKTRNETQLSSFLSSKQIHTATTRLSFKPTDNHTNEIILIQKPIFYEIWLSEKFFCPRLLFNFSKYTKQVKQNQLVPICYSQYVKSWLMKMYRTSFTKRDQNSLAITLSMASTTVSMISSILILTTYSIFPELRFVPGKLLMLLCSNLLLAEGFYNFGMGSDLGTISCKLVGICIHFFWLTTMFCMNSNLWLMLIHMEAPLERKSMKFIHSKSNLPVIKYSCFCFGMASMCVLTNIILSHSIYQDKDYGYGGPLCYINSRQMKVFTFALPIALVLLINFFMFCRIITNISKTVQNKYARVLKARMVVFLKLSTITGFYWTFGFIYESTKIEAFKYLFIVFNGGQGFFLMWSFMLNKRVFELYKKVYLKIFFKENKNQLKSGSVACQEI